MRIEYLSECPEFINTVVGWVYSEFVVKENGTASLEQVADLFGNTNKSCFPITLIAVENNICVGTISLFENDLKSQDKLRPWLASLYVSPNHRGCGVAKKLIEAVEHIARNLGFTKLYLRTEHAADYYYDLRWTYIDTATDKGQQTQIFCKVVV